MERPLAGLFYGGGLFYEVIRRITNGIRQRRIELREIRGPFRCLGLNRSIPDIFVFDPAGRVYNCSRTFSPDWNYRWKHSEIMENRQKLR